MGPRLGDRCQNWKAAMAVAYQDLDSPATPLPAPTVTQSPCIAPDVPVAQDSAGPTHRKASVSPPGGFSALPNASTPSLSDGPNSSRLTPTAYSASGT